MWRLVYKCSQIPPLRYASVGMTPTNRFGTSLEMTTSPYPFDKLRTGRRRLSDNRMVEWFETFQQTNKGFGAGVAFIGRELVESRQKQLQLMN